jgi:hypothetical protein
VTDAYVYYEGMVIRGVSFTIDAALERFDRISIPADMATRFVRGTLDHRDWIVWNNTIQSLKDGELRLTIADTDRDYVTLPRDAAKSSVMLVVSLYRETQRVIFHVVSDFALDCAAERPLSFVFTARGDPSIWLHTLHVAAAEVIEDGMVEMPLPIDPEIAVDVLSRPNFPAYRVEDRAADDVVVAMGGLPRGHFVDLMQFDHAAVDGGLQAVLSRADGTLRLFLAGKTVESYDRSTALLRLLFSMPGDPTLLLHAESVAVDSLRDGTTMKLPQILAQPFDLWSPLLYRKAAIYEVV